MVGVVNSDTSHRVSEFLTVSPEHNGSSCDFLALLWRNYLNLISFFCLAGKLLAF